MRSSIVVPCYNESRNIPLLLEAFKEAVKDRDLEVVLVNNGSTDDTEELLSRLLPQYVFARSVKVEVNQGYGFGILQGLAAARGEYLGWTHADMQTDPRDAIKGLEFLEKAEDPRRTFVKGSRISRSFADSVFTFGMSLFESAYLGVLLNDINAQPNIFHRSFFESWIDAPRDFSLDLYAFYMARKKKMDVVRFPVLFPERIHGQSHWNVDWRSKINFIKRTLDYSVKLRRKVSG